MKNLRHELSLDSSIKVSHPVLFKLLRNLSGIHTISQGLSPSKTPTKTPNKDVSPSIKKKLKEKA